MSPITRAELAALVLLAGCEEITVDPDAAEFPFNAHVEVASDVQQVVFLARVENALRTGERNATFTVSLYDGPLFVASGSASTGRLAPSEVRTASVAFNRALVWSCFQWSVATEDGRRRVSDLVC
ncbi:MAG: hypothetical protein ICV87_04240 [Gemmatimonadetes bacterium]|nr:hypothetical protein [Gemmatimonadota bacterium]